MERLLAFKFSNRQDVLSTVQKIVKENEKYHELSRLLSTIEPPFLPTAFNGFLKACGFKDETYRYLMFVQYFSLSSTNKMSLKDFISIMNCFNVKKRQLMYRFYVKKMVNTTIIWSDAPSIIRLFQSDEICMKHVVFHTLDVIQERPNHDEALGIIKMFANDMNKFEVLAKLINIMPEFNESTMYNNFLDLFTHLLWREKAIPLLMNNIAIIDRKKEEETNVTKRVRWLDEVD